ncbi:MAG: membrane dipeptidase [Candidatus Daviesbacteria bacterium]|nr:membrane dipeptidase [Candidatus Daviesbacteria bacterium]
MRVFDLHIDLSSFCLTTGKKDLLKKGRIGNGFLPDQVDIPRLKKANIKTFLANICPILASEKGFNLPPNSLVETLKQANFYLEQKEKFKKSGINFFLSIEGAYFIKSKEDLSLIPLLKKLGVVSIAPTWNFNNALGAGADDFSSRNGLTRLGRQFVRTCEENVILIDAVHTNKKTFWDLIKYSRKPLFVSHTASFEVKKHRRNLDKEQIKAIVKRGGLIGLCFINDFVGGTSIKDAVKQLQSLVDIAGVENIAVGSDFDGMAQEDLIKGLEDISKLPKFFDACLKNGFTKKDLGKIAGRNAARFFAAKIV